MAYAKQYSKTTWVNNQAPAINATNLNKIEEGIDNVDSGLVEVEESLTERMDALEDDVDALESATGVPAGYVPTADGQDGWEWAAQSGGGLTDGIKQALLQIAQKVAYVDEHGQDYYDDLYDALYPPATLVSIDAVYVQSGTVYTTDTLDSLKSDLTVTAHYDNSTTATIASSSYTLSGTLAEGTSTITVSYSGKTATFNVTVSTHVLFHVENATIDRTSGMVNTNLALLENDDDFSIVFDGIQGTMPSSGAYRILFCSTEDSSWKGMMWGGGASATYASVEYMTKSAGKTYSQMFARNLADTRFRLVYQHSANSGTATIYGKVGDNAESDITLTDSFITNDGSLYIGGAVNDGSSNWVGTVTSCTVYDRILTQAEIAEFMA